MLRIKVNYHYTPHHYQVEQLPNRGGREVWKVHGKNGYMIVSNNRPVLQRHRLKYRSPEWREDTQKINQPRFLEELYEAIEQAVAKGQVNRRTTLKYSYWP